MKSTFIGQQLFPRHSASYSMYKNLMTCLLLFRKLVLFKCFLNVFLYLSAISPQRKYVKNSLESTCWIRMPGERAQNLWGWNLDFLASSKYTKIWELWCHDLNQRTFLPKIWRPEGTLVTSAITQLKRWENWGSESDCKLPDITQLFRIPVFLSSISSACKG